MCDWGRVGAGNGAGVVGCDVVCAGIESACRSHPALEHPATADWLAADVGHITLGGGVGIESLILDVHDASRFSRRLDRVVRFGSLVPGRAAASISCRRLHPRASASALK